MTHLIQPNESNLTNPYQNAGKRAGKVSFQAVDSLKTAWIFRTYFCKTDFTYSKFLIKRALQFEISLVQVFAPALLPSWDPEPAGSWCDAKRCKAAFKVSCDDGTDGTCPLIACVPDGVGPWEAKKRHSHCAEGKSVLIWQRVGKKFFRCVECPISLVAITICGSWPILDVACRADCPSNNETSTSRLMRSVVTACVSNQSTHQHVNVFPGSPSQALPKVQASSPWHWGPVHCAARKKYIYPWQFLTPASAKPFKPASQSGQAHSSFLKQPSKVRNEQNDCQRRIWWVCAQPRGSFRGSGTQSPKQQVFFWKECRAPQNHLFLQLGLA